MLLIDKIAEANILAAQRRGEFDDLEGQGKPLVLDDDSAVPPEMRASYRILKNSGYIPAEISLLAEIARLEQLLNGTESVDEKIQLVAKLGLLKSQLSNGTRS